MTNRTSNDQRSDAKNPNNIEYVLNMENRAEQLNPNSMAYAHSRQGGKRE